MYLRTGLLAACVIVAGCAREGASDAARQAQAARPIDATVAVAALPVSPRLATRVGQLPDRGELASYPGHVQRADGAYTWFRSDISEAHALHAISDGHLRLTTPEGRLLDVRFDRHVEHPSGDWTWIGHLPGEESAQTIITFGERAVFGSIAQPGGKPPLRLTMRDGVSWLVETDPRKVAGIINAATRPTRPDYHVVRRADLPAARTGMRPAAAAPIAAGAPIATTSTATATAANTVDLLVGYTAGFVSAQGSTSAAMTRINHLVDVANAAYVNSQVPAQVRLVHAMQVSYTDLNTNDTALEEMSGYKSGVGPVTPNAAFNALRNARETYGADLVTLVRPFKDPEQDSCGLAWLLGGAKQGIQPGAGWDDLAYSVIGDGEDVGSDGKTYFCREETLAHEMGHNEGSAHDRETAKGDDGVLDDPDDYGAFTYSFGYKTTATTGNFYTVMAYGDSGQTGYRVFSNPRITFCGGRACGTTTFEDNARSLGQTIPVVATFRQTKIATGSVRNDLNHDGRSDLLWRYQPTGTLQLWMMNARTMTSHVNLAQPPSFSHLANGDFNADGFVDIAWRDSSNQVTIWLNDGLGGFTRYTISGLNSDWILLDAIDINGDKKCDFVWRHVPTGTVQYWLMNGAARASYRNLTQSASYQFLAAGDFDSDGFGDLAWRKADNRVAIWKGNGATFTETSIPGLNRDWQVLDALDINGDGKSDLLWRYRPSGSLQYWLMDGPRLASYRNLAQSASYVFLGSGDYNGDGRADIAWRRIDQRVAIWLGNGATFTEASISGLNTDWIPLNQGQ